MKVLNDNKAITLVALVVTVVILLILAGISINFVLGENGIVLKSQDASQKYSKESKREQQILDDASAYIDTMEWKVEWKGEIVANNGILEVPVDLTDLKYTYELTIESDKYSGPAILHVYSREENAYMGKISINNQGAYGWKLRNIESGSPGNIDNYTTIDFLDNSDSNYGTLTYNNSELGDLKITNVSKNLKQYSMVGKLILKLEDGQDYNIDDFTPFIDYALSKNDLGYKYVNQNLTAGDIAEESSQGQVDKDTANAYIQKVEFDEAKERQLLSYIKNTGYEDIKAIEKIIRDETISTLLSSINIQAHSYYTIADYIEENPFLSEVCNRAVGNSIIPFTYLFFNQSVLNDLNADGYIETDIQKAAVKNINSAPSPKNLYNIGEYAGLACRLYSDMYAVVNNNYSEDNLTLLQDAQNTFEDMYNSIITYWMRIYNIYNNKNLNSLYGYLHNKGITINMAGVRLGYYSSILPVVSGEFAEKGITFNDSYNPLQDTKYLNEQGITQTMINELMAAMSSQNNGD